MAHSSAPLADYGVISQNGSFAVLRNGAAIKTPAGQDLELPTEALAEAVAAEWRAQKNKINHASMPVTQLALTALDIARRHRADVAREVADYAVSDMLCFFAEEPDELVHRQRKIWQPALDWCAERFDALLSIGQGVMPVEHSPDALNALHRAVGNYDDFVLTGIRYAADTSGSLVLALALAEGFMTAREVFEAAELDSSFQAEQWGDDPAAHERRDSILKDLELCERWFSLLRDSGG